MPKAVETANPRQYLRLLLMRLLETQAAIRPMVDLPSMGVVRQQYRENEYILSEIKSWLESQPPETASPLGPSESTVRSAETSGPESSSPASRSEPAEAGPTKNPFVWRTYRPTVPVATSQVRSSLRSGYTLPAGAKIINGRIVFQKPCSCGKQPCICDGGSADCPSSK